MKIFNRAFEHILLPVDSYLKTDNVNMTGYINSDMYTAYNIGGGGENRVGSAWRGIIRIKRPSISHQKLLPLINIHDMTYHEYCDKHTYCNAYSGEQSAQVICICSE